MPKNLTSTINIKSELTFLNTQFVKLYYETNVDKCIEEEINKFLQDNPSYTVQNMSLGVSRYRTVCAVTYQQHII
jgi:hypothetical protein